MNLRERSDLATLRSFAAELRLVSRRLPDGQEAEIDSWTVPFPPAVPDRLAEGALKRTYTSKPLVVPYADPLFGELAILRCLERDGWDGVWVDTFHGSELFWRNMPHLYEADDLSEAPAALDRYRSIVAEHGRRGGFFDVMAWKDDEFLFIEYKGKGDRPNANERSWIAAALRRGVSMGQLLFVEYG